MGKPGDNYNRRGQNEHYNSYQNNMMGKGKGSNSAGGARGGAAGPPGGGGMMVAYQMQPVLVPISGDKYNKNYRRGNKGYFDHNKGYNPVSRGWEHQEENDFYERNAARLGKGGDTYSASLGGSHSTSGSPADDNPNKKLGRESWTVMEFAPESTVDDKNNLYDAGGAVEIAPTMSIQSSPVPYQHAKSSGKGGAKSHVIMNKGNYHQISNYYDHHRHSAPAHVYEHHHMDHHYQQLSKNNYHPDNNWRSRSMYHDHAFYNNPSVDEYNMDFRKWSVSEFLSYLRERGSLQDCFGAFSPCTFGKLRPLPAQLEEYIRLYLMNLSDYRGREDVKRFVTATQLVGSFYHMAKMVSHATSRAQELNNKNADKRHSWYYKSLVHPDHNLVQEYIRSWEDIANDFMPIFDGKLMANAIYAYGILQVVPGAIWLSKWEDFSTTNIDLYNVQGLSNSIYAFAMFARRPSKEFIKAWERRCISVMEVFTAQGLVNSIFAFGRLSILREGDLFQPTDEFLRVWEHRVVEILPEFNEQELAMCLFALGKIDSRPSQTLFEAWETRAFEIFDKLNAQALTNSVYAFSKLRKSGGDHGVVGTSLFPSKKFLELWEVHATYLIKDFSSQGLTRSMTALAELNHKPGEKYLFEWQRATTVFVMDRITKAEYLTQIIVAFAKSCKPHCVSDLLLRTWQQKAATVIHDFSESELADCIAVLSEYLPTHVTNDFLEKWDAEAFQKVSNFSGDDVEKAVYALTNLGFGANVSKFVRHVTSGNYISGRENNNTMMGAPTTTAAASPFVLMNDMIDAKEDEAIHDFYQYDFAKINGRSSMGLSQYKDHETDTTLFPAPPPATSPDEESNDHDNNDDEDQEDQLHYDLNRTGSWETHKNTNENASSQSTPSTMTTNTQNHAAVNNIATVPSGAYCPPGYRRRKPTFQRNIPMGIQVAAENKNNTEAVNKDNTTTLYIRNIPLRLDEHTLLSDLICEVEWNCILSEENNYRPFDFFYMPVDAETNLNNAGYAFINMIDHRDEKLLKERINNNEVRTSWSYLSSNKQLRAEHATLQGYDANAEFYLNKYSSTARRAKMSAGKLYILNHPEISDKKLYAGIVRPPKMVLVDEEEHKSSRGGSTTSQQLQRTNNYRAGSSSYKTNNNNSPQQGNNRRNSSRDTNRWSDDQSRPRKKTDENSISARDV